MSWLRALTPTSQGLFILTVWEVVGFVALALALGFGVGLVV